MTKMRYLGCGTETYLERETLDNYKQNLINVLSSTAAQTVSYMYTDRLLVSDR